MDNDGHSDLVVKTTFCMKGSPSDSVYVFPSDSAVLELADWQDLSHLLVSLADGHAEWIVVAQYRGGARFEDLCYVRAAVK